MSELRLSFPASAIAGKGRLTANDILLLQTETFPDGITDTDGAALLFALHGACRETCPEWADFFIDSLTRFIVHHTFPQGSLDEANALWLERMLAADGIIASDLELKLLMHVLNVAAHVPDSLKVFAISQLRHAIHGGSGAYAGWRRGPQRGIDNGDIEFVKSVIAAGDPEARNASSALYRLLLSIDAITNPAQNENGWVRLLYTMRMGDQAARNERNGAARGTQRRSAGMAA